MSTSREMLQAAWQHQQAGRLEDAEQLVREVLAAQPRDTAALRLLGGIASRRGQPAQAVDHLRRAADLDPKDAHARFDLGAALAATGDTHAALGAWQEAAGLRRQDAEFQNHVGVALAQHAAWEAAAECLHRAVHERPDFAAAASNLGNVLVQQGKLDEAVAAFQQSLAAAPDVMQTALSLANCYKIKGQFAQAIELYERALPAAPQDPLLRFHLGQALSQAGRWNEAAAHLIEALRAKPDFAEGHAELGFALRALGQREAVDALQAAVQLNPLLPGVQLALGDLLFDHGRVHESIACYELAVARQPDSVAAQTSLGNALRVVGRHEEAIRRYEYAARLRPDLPEPHVNLGLIYHQLKRSDDAVARFRQALEIRPDFAPAHNGLGAALESQGKSAEAVACFREALRLQPDYVEAHSNLGASLGELGKTSAGPETIAEGRAELERALQLQPDFAEAHGNLGKLLMGAPAEPAASPASIDAARQALERALELKPTFVEARANLAKLLGDQGDLAGALSHYDEAVRQDPSSASVHNNRALTRLLAGDFARGWPEYEWRWRLPDAPVRPWPIPEWDGSPLDGRTVMLHCEQGLGDSLQFIRYAPLVQRQCGHLFLIAPKNWLAILRTCLGLDPDRVTFQDEQSPLPPIDVRASVMSLPGLLKTALDTIPADVPYLAADEALVPRWRDALGADDALRVGVVWQGNPKFGADRARSFPLSVLAPLARVPRVRVYSLQKGFGAEQIAAADFPIVDLGSRFSDDAMVDAAAVIRSLDLVISCDTAMLHLAGALAAGAWGAIPFAPDWRWLLERQDSPWYPTLRLFRQARPGDWPEVIQRMATELSQLAAARHGD